MRCRWVTTLVIIPLVAAFLGIGADASPTGTVNFEAQYGEVQLLFPEPHMSTKGNSTDLAQAIAGRLGLGQLTGDVSEYLNPFENPYPSLNPQLYRPQAMRAPPGLNDFDEVIPCEHVGVMFHCNQSDLMLTYGGNHSDAPFIALILYSGNLNVTAEDEAGRSTASLDIIETLGIPSGLVSSFNHSEEEDSYTVVLSGEAQGVPLSWCNLAVMRFSFTTSSVYWVQILPFVTADPEYYSLAPEATAEMVEPAIEDELKDGDLYQACELESIRLVIVREILQVELTEESNATYMEEFRLRLGYEFSVTVKDSRYSVDFIDLVVLDCSSGSTLLIVKGPQPIGVVSPFVILLPGFAILGVLIVLVILFFHFETSPEFAILLLQSSVIPVFTRIRGVQALDSFNRGRIFEQVRMHPGSSFTNLKESLGMGNGTLAYHLSVLQKLELVRSMKDGRERRYFLCGVNLQYRPDMWLGRTEARVLEELLTNGPMSASKVANRLDISRQRVHYNMRLLVKRGLAVHERPLWKAAQNQASTHTQES